MNYDIFRLGIEVEGYFSTSLSRLLERHEWYLGYDASVKNIDSYSNIPKDIVYSSYTEVASPILSYSMLKKQLQFFKHPQYVDVEDAGIHLHVSSRYHGWSYIPLIDYKLHKLLFDIITKRMPRKKIVMERISNSKWCDAYDKTSFLREAKNHAKYRWMRYHPQGTLEFRLLPSISNPSILIKMVNSILYGLNKIEKYIRSTYTDADIVKFEGKRNEKKKLELSFDVKKGRFVSSFK